MKSLLILRHAKSSWKDESLPDHDRPLNRRGRAAAPEVGELIRQEGLLPDLVISSSAVRARSTAELAAEAGGFDCEIQITRDLYAADPEAILAVLAGLNDRFDRVLIVGHNPGVEDLVFQLTRQIRSMPTAALAWIELDAERWQELGLRTRGKLNNLWTPKGGD